MCVGLSAKVVKISEGTAVFSAKLRPVFAGILNGYSVKNKVENKA